MPVEARSRYRAGQYLTGTLEVHSYTTLNLTPGATLLGSTRMQDYTQGCTEARAEIRPDIISSA